MRARSRWLIGRADTAAAAPHSSAEQYIRAYRECGDVYGRESETLAITGLPKELNENEAILNLKAILGLGLAESKAFVEQIAGKGKIEVALKNESEAEEAKIKM